MVRTLLAVGVFFALAVAAGCSDGGGEPAPPTPTLSKEEQAYAATVAAVATIAAKPLSTPGRFSSEAVNAAIAAINSGDSEAVLDLFLTTSIDCDVDPPEFSSIPSCAASVDGRLEEVLPVTNCDFRYLPGADAKRAVRSRLEAGRPEVYGVYPIHGSAFWTRYRMYDGPQYAMVLRTIRHDRVSGWLLVFNEDGFIGFSSGCSLEPDSVVAAWWFAGQMFSEDQRTPTPTLTPLPTLAAPRPTGIESVDAAIEAIQRRDASALVDLIEMTPVRCVTEKVGLEPEPWCKGEALGTLVESFPIAYCKGGFVGMEVAEGAVESFALEPLEVFSVHHFVGSRLATGFWGRTAAEFVLVLQRVVDGRVTANALLLSAEAIVGQVDSCGAPPEQMIAFWQLNDPVIAPARPPVTPTPYLPKTPVPVIAPRTGIEVLDAAIDAIENGDPAALVNLAERSPTGIPVGGYCHRDYYPSLNALRIALRPLESRLLEVYALYRTDGSRILQGFFAGVESRYVLLVRQVSRPGRGVVLVFDDEHLVGHTSTCGLPLEDYSLGMELTDAIIPPPDER